MPVALWPEGTAVPFDALTLAGGGELALLPDGRATRTGLGEATAWSTTLGRGR